LSPIGDKTVSGPRATFNGTVVVVVVVEVEVVELVVVGADVGGGV
jgi:hypothetical protein